MPSWRKDTIILIDGAPYHSSDETLEHMNSLNLPIMFLGPASYNDAPCELMFAQIKSVLRNQ